MNKNEDIILMDSDDAAKSEVVTAFGRQFTLWMAANGSIYSDEHSARYAGATHKKCSTDGCHNVCHKSYSVCDSCQKVRAEEKSASDYARADAEPWDGISPVYDDLSGRYFFDAEEIDEYLFEEFGIEDPTGDDVNANMRLYHCVRQSFRAIDVDDFMDDISVDGESPETPEELHRLVGEFNERLSKIETNVWEPDMRTKVSLSIFD